MSFEEEEAERKKRKRKEEEEARAEEKKNKALEAQKALALKNKKDMELNAWRYQYPSSIVSLQVIGDPVYANLFMGEGKALLYSVINAMKFNKLGQLSNRKVYPDGTIVMAKSVFGQNTIEIDVSKSAGAGAGAAAAAAITCTITPMNVPLSVQPMRFPGEIHQNEVEGVDYLKIYYVTDVTNCLNCSDITWEVEVKGCIDSMEHTCWGQVFQTGHDGKGNFILVKFFTEKFIFSRTGLSDMNLIGWIRKPDGSVACNVQKGIKVDCCLKDASLRRVEIWWDSGNCGASSCIVTTLTTSDLYDYAWGIYGGSGIFYADMGDDGGCIPFGWAASMGKITPLNEFWTKVKYTPPGSPESPVCNDYITIKASDRCGTTYQIEATPCCDGADPLTMDYTSLQMSCGQQQYLYAVGGCGPFHWEVSAGGGSVEPSTSRVAVYSAPNSNPNCSSNPTVRVTDCCGNTAQVQIAVNCYTPYWGTALGICHFTDCGGCWYETRGRDQGLQACVDEETIHYDCLGNILTDTHTSNCDWSWEPGAPCAFGSQSGFWTHTTYADCHLLGYPDNPVPPLDCTGQMIDLRTTEMKSQGCCPLNPLTGLPY